MASAKLRKKANSDKFLSPEQTRTIKPADFKSHAKLKDLSHDDLVELLCLMEAELQAKDVLLKAVLSSDAGTALPLSHLMNDAELAKVGNVDNKSYLVGNEEEDEIWLGEPSAHLNHVVAYHQVVREQMQATVDQLQKVHKEVVDQLDEECHKHAVDTAQGDDVTYMLEKERERLQQQIDQEQAKYTDLEEERDTLRSTLEQERRQYYNTFNELLNDCKALAQQLVQHTIKNEKHQKEVDKEKQKNKVLSELMVEETRKFKERLSQYEEEVSDFHVLEQKKCDLEDKLGQSDKRMKETFHTLSEERQKNAKLVYEVNQLRKQFPDYHHDDSNEDILLVQEQIEIPVKEARTSSIQLSQQDRFSPEPSTVLPPAVPVHTAKVATVQKSSSVRQTKGYATQQVKSGIITSTNNHTDRVSGSFNDNQKRRSYEEKKGVRNYSQEEAVKRNSLEGPYDGGIQIRNTGTVKQKHNSYEEMRNVGSPNTTPKRNSYEGDSKKVPPPAPPRRGSTLTPQDRPPIVKIPQQLQPRKSNTIPNNDAYKRSNTTDEILLMLTLVYDIGWEFEADNGFVDSTQLVDFLAILPVKSSFTWSDITNLINQTFQRECQHQLQNEQGDKLDSILSYEYGDTVWNMEDIPAVTFSKVLSQRLHPITIRLKGADEGSLCNLSYSSFIPASMLEECLRILDQEKKLMFTVSEEMEGKYTVACLARSIKMNEELKNVICEIITVESDACRDMKHLTNTLANLGILYKGEEERLPVKYIVIFNIDCLENEGCTSTVFDWLSFGNERKKSLLCNGYENDDENYRVHRDVTVIAYATNNKVTGLSQRAYRLFKIISLPSVHQALITRWLRQNIVAFTPQQVYELRMVNTVKWLSEVYQNLHKSFFKIELIHKLPDVSVYLVAPLEDMEELYDWVKELWNESITPCVEESVRQRTIAATETQRDLLIKATLKALFEKSIRTGCPVELKF